jgi:hypothetical protein
MAEKVVNSVRMEYIEALYQLGVISLDEGMNMLASAWIHRGWRVTNVEQ